MTLESVSTPFRPRKRRKTPAPRRTSHETIAVMMIAKTTREKAKTLSTPCCPLRDDDIVTTTVMEPGPHATMIK